MMMLLVALLITIAVFNAQILLATFQEVGTTYLGPRLDVTCSRIDGEIIIHYSLQKSESTFMYNRKIPWRGPQIQLILQPDDRPGEFALHEDVYGKHAPTGIHISSSIFDLFIRKTSRIFLRFKKGICVQFRVDYE